jgi:hypothetical protein
MTSNRITKNTELPCNVTLQEVKTTRLEFLRLLGLPNSEFKNTTFLRNVCNYLTQDTALHYRRIQSWLASMWEPQFSKHGTYFKVTIYIYIYTYMCVCVWQNNIKVNLREIGCEVLDFIQLFLVITSDRLRAISDFRSGINELRSSSMLRSVDWHLPTFRDNLSIPSSRVKQSL